MDMMMTDLMTNANAAGEERLAVKYQIKNSSLAAAARIQGDPELNWEIFLLTYADSWMLSIIGSYIQDFKFKYLVQVKKILVLKIISQYKSCKSS